MWRENEGVRGETWEWEEKMKGFKEKTKECEEKLKGHKEKTEWLRCET
jgi:hypothetical protein